VFTLAPYVAQVNDGAKYTSLAAAIGAASAGDTVTLLADQAIEQTTVSKSLTLDLGGNTLTGRLTINDGTVTVQNGTVAGRFDAYDASTVTIAPTATVAGYVLVWGDGTYGAEGCKTPTLNVYGTIEAGDEAAIVQGNGDVSHPSINIFDGAVINSALLGVYVHDGASLTMSGGAINSADCGVGVRTGASFAMTGGSITAGSFGVYNNGGETNYSSTIAVSGGTIASTNETDTACGIYQAGPGTLTISGTAVVRGPDAVEVRAGTVEVLDDAQLIATMAYTAPASNGNGNSGHGGVALLVSQHTTAQAIEATVSGGTLEGEVAFAEVTVEAENDGSLVAGSIDGGTISGAVTTENIETLIPSDSAALFSDADAEGVEEGYMLAESTTQGFYEVVKAWTVVYENYDGTGLQTNVVAEGSSTPAYEGDDPVKPADAQYTYTFQDFGEVAATVTTNATYTAQFSETLNEYAVVFTDHSGTVASNNYAYGTTPGVPETAPVSYAEGTTVYTGTWPTVSAVTNDTTYEAVYTGAAAVAMVTYVSGGETVVRGVHATLDEAVSAAQAGDTVKLLADVTLAARVDVDPGAGTTLAIDLGGYTITREGTSGNGSAFDVKSGDVTIANGTLDCTQDDAAIVADGVYAITVRSGANATLAGLEVRVDSECGACAYPFAGATLAIESGTYANETTTPYRYKPEWTGMAVNQANVAESLITITGGTFSKVDPALGDDSAAEGAMSFVDDAYVTVIENGAYVVHEAVTVTFVNDKGDAPAAQKIAKGATANEPEAPEAEGFLFAGWFAEGATEAFDFDTLVDADLTLTAAWDAVVAEIVGGAQYASLAQAVAAAGDGDTVLLLADVTLDTRVEPNPGAGKKLTIDLGGKTITREGTSGNGSAFDVKSGDVTITNGTIDCTQDDAAIVADGVYAITVRSGADATLAGLEVRVDSECGACAYPFAGATLAIESGTYANETTTPYRHKPAWTGMAVNQANVAESLITITGGTFSKVDPALGDDSAAEGAMSFVDDAYVTVIENGAYVVHEAVTVTFVNEKGDAPAAQKIAKGTTASEPEDPEYACWTFQYWMLGDGTEYDFATPVTEDIELAACWTRDIVTLTVPAVEHATVAAETNGVALAGTEGANGTTLYQVEAGTAVDVTYTAVEGYHVTGSDETARTYPISAGVMAHDFTLDASGTTMTIYTYVVTFTWHGGVITYECEYGTSMSAPPNNPPSYVTNGMIYSFTGWNPAEIVSPVTADAAYEARYDDGVPAIAIVNIVLDDTVDPPVTETIGTYASLREAIAHAPEEATVVLLADDTVSFANVEVAGGVPSNGAIVIDGDSIVIDGAGFTVTGISDAGILNATGSATPGYDMVADLADGSNLIGFFVKSGDVTFKDIALTGFGDTAYVNKFGYTPIQTASAWDGDLVLENVDIDKFNRTAVCLRGGTLTMTGGTITANATNKTDDHFQQPIEIRGGIATIDGVTVESDFAYDNGGGAIVAWSDTELANVVVDFKGIGIWSDGAAVTVTGDGTVVEATDDAIFAEEAGSVTVEAGNFTGALEVDRDPDSTITVNGGWFDEQVPVEFAGEGLAPTTIAEGGKYTVKTARTVTFVSEGATYATAVVADGEPATAPATDPEKEGYLFTGWLPDISAAVTSNTTYTAQFVNDTWTMVPVTSGATVDGNTASYADLTVPYSAVDASLGRNWVAAWVGVNVIAPDSVTAANIAKIKYDRAGNACQDGLFGGSDARTGSSFANNNDGTIDGHYYIGVWVPLSADSVRALIAGETVVYREYSFYNEDTPAAKQTFRVEISPENIILAENSVEGAEAIETRGWNEVIAVPEAATGLVYDGTEKTGVAAGTGYALAGTTAATAAGGYSATATLADHCIWADDTSLAKEIDWAIGKATVAVTAEAKTQVYGEAPEALTYTSVPATLVEGNAFSGELARAPGDTVGTYAINVGTLTAGDNYEIAFTGADYEITAAEATVPTAVEGLVYDGAEKTGVAAGTGYTLAGNTATNAGDYTATATLAANYVWNDGTSAAKEIGWSIAPAGITVTVEGTASSAVYNGDRQTKPVAYTLASDDALYDAAKVVYSGAETVAGTAVGSYAYGLAASAFGYDDANVDATFAVTDGTFEITPASITITVTGLAAPSVPYTGEEQTGDVTYQVSCSSALYDLANVVYTGAATVSGTNAGTYAYGLKASDFAYDDDNVEAAFSVTDAAFEIVPAAITVTVTGTDAELAVYTGGEQTADVVYTLASNDALYDETKVAYSGAATVSGTDAGRYAYGLQASDFSYDDANVEATFQVTDAAFAIVPAPVTVKADDATKTAGNDDPEFTATVTGLLSAEDAVAYTFTREEGETVGEYAITPEGATFQGNYEVAFESGTLTISGAIAKDSADNYYGSLAAAVEGAPEDATVTLLANVSEGAISVAKNLVLDLGGFTNAMTDACTVVSGATLQIANGALESGTGLALVADGDGSGIVLGEGLAVSGTGTLLYATGGGTVTVYGAAVTGTDARDAAAVADRGGIVAVLSGSIASTARSVSVSGTDSGFVLEDGTVESTGSNPVMIARGATASVSGGTVSSANYAAFWVTGDGSSAEIDGAEIRATGAAASAIEVANGASVAIADGTFSAQNHAAASVKGASSLLSVDGGAFSGRYGLYAGEGGAIEIADGTVVGTSAALYADGEGTIAVSGGWFSHKVADGFVASTRLYASGALDDAPDAAAPYTVLERPVEMTIARMENLVIDEENGTASFTLVATEDTDDFTGSTAKAYVTEDLLRPEWRKAEEALVTVAADGKSVSVEGLALGTSRMLFVRIGFIEE
jgi:uncharacterized repeat protein (TIGR02543 family)